MWNGKKSTIFWYKECLCCSTSEIMPEVFQKFVSVVRWSVIHTKQQGASLVLRSCIFYLFFICECFPIYHVMLYCFFLISQVHLVNHSCHFSSSIVIMGTFSLKKIGRKWPLLHIVGILKWNLFFFEFYIYSVLTQRKKLIRIFRQISGAIMQIQLEFSWNEIVSGLFVYQEFWRTVHLAILFQYF